MDKADATSKACGVDRMIELDFKYFYCLIADREDIRIVFILKVPASNRLKELTSNLSMGICLQLSEQLENWDGSLDYFEEKIPEIFAEYIDLEYKEYWTLTRPADLAMIRKESELSSMETRVLNVIRSFAKGKEPFYLKRILELVHEENQDVVIEAIETLIERNIILPYVPKQLQDIKKI